MTTAGITKLRSHPDYVSRAERDEDLAFQIESIDLERLAEEVIVLLKRELRLERERQGSFPQYR